MGELILDIGIEIEFINVSQEKLSNILAKNGLLGSEVNVIHDASAETPIIIEPNTGFHINNNSKFPIRNTKKGTKGGELVTTIWFNGDPGKILGDLRKLTHIFSTMGEGPKSTRAGVHFHINYSYNINILKNLILLGGHLENFFYCFGGFGYENRAVQNRATYFRPITRKGPPVIETPEGYAQVFTTESLLEATSAEEFFRRYADFYNVGGRYVPVRYTWLNLYNLAKKDMGTLEFRVFNVSLNPLYLWTALQFCSEFAKFCVTTTPEQLKEDGLAVENSVFDEQSKDEIVTTLDNFAEVSQLPEKIYNLTRSIIEVSPETTFEETYMFSHLLRKGNSPTHWRDGVYSPKILRSSDIQNPIYEDIHTLRGGT